MQFKAKIMDEHAMSRAIARISFEIIERNRGIENLCVIGILTRGVDIAKRIAKKIGEIEDTVVPVGTMDITPFRDDVIDDVKIDQSDIPFSLGGCNVVLVDDVIHTGRSARAAIDAVMSRGRPESVQFATLVDRGHRQLPIRPDYVGKNAPTSSSEMVRVSVKDIDGVDKVEIWEKEK